MASNLLAKSECFSVRAVMASSRRSVVVRRVPCSAMDEAGRTSVVRMRERVRELPCFEVKAPPEGKSELQCFSAFFIHGRSLFIHRVHAYRNYCTSGYNGLLTN